MSRPSRPPGDALARRRRVGRERRLRPEGNVTSGLGRPKAGSGVTAKAAAPVRDPTAPYYGGAAPSGARVGARGHGRSIGSVAVPKARPGEVRSAEPREPQEVRKDLGQKSPRGTPGGWHPKKLNELVSGVLLPRSLTVPSCEARSRRGIGRARS